MVISSTHLDHTFQALADPHRRAMLVRLTNGAASVSDLAKPFLHGMSLPAVTKHLKVLEKAGLITKSRDAHWRHCKLNGDAFKDAALWMEQYRAFWEESFDRLDAYLKTVVPQTEPGEKNGPQKKNRRVRTHRNHKSL